MEILSSLFDALNDIFPSDDNYAEELQFQEALHASLNTISTPPSSSSQTISCEICTDEKHESEMFQVPGCPHSFCIDCISKHAEYKLQDNIFNVSCPEEDCNNVIDIGSLRSIVAEDLMTRWEQGIIKSMILDSQKVHCPYEDCSEMLVKDVEDEGVVITESECPKCWRLFCAECKVPWHEGFDCSEFRRYKGKKKEKEELRLLAKENKWKKCPNCKVFVDKTEGCIHITCRCKFEFCYVCGLRWNENHWNTCQE